MRCIASLDYEQADLLLFALQRGGVPGEEARLYACLSPRRLKKLAARLQAAGYLQDPEDGFFTPTRKAWEHRAEIRRIAEQGEEDILFGNAWSLCKSSRG